MNDKIENICNKGKKSCLSPITNNYTLKDGASTKLEVENKKKTPFYKIKMDGCLLEKGYGDKGKRADWILHNNKNRILFIELKTSYIKFDDLLGKFKDSKEFLNLPNSYHIKNILICKRTKKHDIYKKLKTELGNFEWFNDKEYVRKDITELFNFEQEK